MAMVRALLALFLVIAMMSSASTQERCPANQEWTTCGSACPPRCNSPPNERCTYQCVIGCRCKQGFVLNSSGQCVQPQDC